MLRFWNLSSIDPSDSQLVEERKRFPLLKLNPNGCGAPSPIQARMVTRKGINAHPAVALFISSEGGERHAAKRRVAKPRNHASR